MNIRIVLRLVGGLIVFFTLSMLVTFPFAMWYGEWEELVGIGEAMVIGLLFGGALFFAGEKVQNDLMRREALAVVGLCWILVSAVGALPLLLGGLVDSYTDAFFESVSGITTTGSTIMVKIEGQAKSLLFWRTFLHFVGGLGIIVFFVAILPILGVGGKALFKQEVPGPVPEGFTPRIKDTALALAKIYIGLNLLQFILLKIAGMSWFDAINHAMSTLATGGFSTRDTSVFAFHSPLIEWIIIVFMFLAGANFSLHRRFLAGEWHVYFKDTEFRVYVGAIFFFTILFTVTLFHMEDQTNRAVSHPGLINLRDGFFTSLTIITTTGFGTVDYDAWPAYTKVIILILMFVGGMAGSTAGGMKLIRWIILAKSAVHELNQEVSPRRVRIAKIGSQPLSREVQYQILVYFFIYFAVFGLGSTVIKLLMPQQDFVTSITAVIACLNNIGPGLAGVGPTMSYAEQSNLTKWFLSFLMIAGRLELYAILLLFAPSFWRGR